MSLLDILQILSVILGLSGNILVNRRNVNGFKFWIVGNFMAISVMAMTHLWWMLAMQISYLFLAIDGLRKWEGNAEAISQQGTAGRDVIKTNAISI